MEVPEPHVTTTEPPPSGALWLAFSRGTPAHVAWQRFVDRFGYTPEMVIPMNIMVWAGPVKESQE